jgi:hypothetical protein
VAEKIASEILALPMYPQLEFSQQHRVAQKVLNFFDQERLTKSGSNTLSGLLPRLV